MNFGQYSNDIIKKDKEEVSKKISLDKLFIKKTVFEKCILKINLTFRTKENFNIRYPKNIINFNINKYDKILITGQSGKGKSTLLDIICDFKKPNSGNIKFLNIKRKKLIKKV